MKTIYSKKAIIGAGAVALVLAMGISQASAFTIGGITFFGSDKTSSNVESNTSADASFNANAQTGTSGSGSTGSNTSIDSNLETTGMLNADSNGVNVNTNLDGSLTSNGEARSNWNTENEVNTSFVTRVAAFFRSLFSFGSSSDVTTDAALNVSSGIR